MSPRGAQATSDASLQGITPQAAAEKLLERREMRVNLATFVKKVFATVDPGALYKHNWHIDLMCEYLEAAYHRQIMNLIINVPPRFLKSLCVSVGFPAWLLGQDPSERIISASGVASLATKHSTDCRKVLREPWYQNTFPDVVLTDHQDAKNRYETTRGGHRIAMSVGGSSVGEGGRVKLIDDPTDPHKLGELESANTWYDNTWSTRSDDPERTIEVLVMQRVGINDLTGHLLNKGGWEHLVIPQEAEKKTIIIFPISKTRKVREEGELIHAARFGLESVNKAKVNLGTYGYDSQHQQKPTARGGNRIKLPWFPRYGTLPAIPDEVAQSWDTGNKAKDLSNPSVCETFMRFGEKWFLAHVFKKKMAYPELKRTVKSLNDHYKPNIILIEDKASGTQLLQDYEGKLRVKGVEPNADKAMRMEVQLPALEAGMLALPDTDLIDADWLFEFEQNLQSFPMNKEWDEIDALSQFLRWLKDRQGEESAIIAPFSLSKSSLFRGR